MKSYQKAFTGIVLASLFFFNSVTTLAQKSNRPITSNEKKQVIEKVFSILNDKYIFPEKVPAIQKEIGGKLANGGYAKYETAEEFLKNLNADLERLSNDRHVNVFFDPVYVNQIKASEHDTSSQVTISPKFLQRAKFENFMVRNVERLDGNVGYLKFNKFLDLNISKPTLVAAMDLLAHSSALIIDLRQNGGGYSSTTQFLLNYFLPDSTLLGTFTSRLNNTTTKIYTQPDPLSRKFPDDVPVYILTSKRTSSAAEAFAYNLQAFKRATIIGDTSNGEANPGFALVINQEMYMMVPTSINRNAITNSNWQGVGVIPDIKTSAQKSYQVAQAMAYEQLAKKSDEADRRFFYEWMASGIAAEINPVQLSVKELETFEGKYEDNRIITFTEGNLYYARAGASGKKLLKPVTEDTFTPEGAPFFRVRFIRNSNGQTTALEGIYDDGKKEISKRIK